MSILISRRHTLFSWSPAELHAVYRWEEWAEPSVRCRGLCSQGRFSIWEMEVGGGVYPQAHENHLKHSWGLVMLPASSIRPFINIRCCNFPEQVTGWGKREGWAVRRKTWFEDIWWLEQNFGGILFRWRPSWLCRDQWVMTPHWQCLGPGTPHLYSVQLQFLTMVGSVHSEVPSSIHKPAPASALSLQCPSLHYLWEALRSLIW